MTVAILVWVWGLAVSGGGVSAHYKPGECVIDDPAIDSVERYTCEEFDVCDLVRVSNHEPGCELAEAIK